MSSRKVVVLGVSGHIGGAVAAAFAERGWTVSGMARQNRRPVPGVAFVPGDSDSVEDMRRAIGDAEVVVNALNLPYHTWDQGRMEAQMARVIAAVGSAGRTVLFPGNIYNYSAADRVVTPDLPQRPQTPRGAIRVRVEQLFEAAAARGDLQAIILRAGDFYGPGAERDWFDQAILRSAAKGRVAVMGRPGVGHSWAYLPDLARAFEALAAMRGSLAPFERFHFAGHYATPEQMGAAILAAAPEGTRLSTFPLALLKLGGLVDPVLREAGRMDYLWRHPMELRDQRLDAILGPGFGTPFGAAVAATVRRFFAPRAAVAQLGEPGRPARV